MIKNILCRLVLFMCLMPTVLLALPKVLLNGKSLAKSDYSFKVGQRFLLHIQDAKHSHRVRIVEDDTGMVWYNGSAHRFAMNKRTLAFEKGTLRIEVYGTDLKPVVIKRLNYEITATKFLFAPGARLRMMRMAETIKTTFPSQSDFNDTQQQAMPLGNEVNKDIFKNYTPFRSAEMAQDPKDDTFYLPNYWHRPYPTLAIGNTDSFVENKDKPLFSAIPNDIWTHRAALSWSGLIMVEPNTKTVFRVLSTIPTQLTVNGSNNKPSKLTITRSMIKVDDKKNASPSTSKESKVIQTKNGFIRFDLISTECNHVKNPAILVQMRQSSDEPWQAVEAWRILHIAHESADKAYRTFFKDSAHKVLSMQMDAQKHTEANPYKTPTNLTDFNINGFRATCQALSVHYQKNGDTETAKQLLEALLARLKMMRQTTDPQYVKLGFGKVHGQTIRLWIEMLPFLKRCERSPILQPLALQVRAEMTLACDRIWARSFFSEANDGTNDGYGDDSNFIVNIWRCAMLSDTPLAYDGARSLYDSHFAYAPYTNCGFMRDGTINFHNANGRQLNMGAYGKDWVTRILHPTHFGSPWGNSREAYERLVQYTLNYEWFYYKDAMAFCANGRHNTHNGHYNKGFSDRLLNLPPMAISETSKIQLKAMNKRLDSHRILNGNRFFERQLMSVHRRADYYIDVKMSSPLSGGVETFAGNYSGNLSFADGVTTLLRHGDEYRPIHRYTIPDSLWRFRALPGTTQHNVEWGSNHVYKGLDRYRAGGGARAGGVSDGEVGHCAFDFHSHKRNASAANKMFTFTENGMMVLGSKISGWKPAEETFSYRSTINQTTFKDKVVIYDGEKETLLREISAPTTVLPLNRSYWIEHNGIGYFIPKQTSKTLHIEIATRTPSNRLASHIFNHPDVDMQKYKASADDLTAKGRAVDIVTIWIDHGPQPNMMDMSYFVAMRPERYPKGAGFMTKDAPIKLIQNTDQCQAVLDTESKTLHVMFYTAGTLPAPYNITVDRPASVMLRQIDDTWAVIAIQDPIVACTRNLTQMSHTITLSINGEKHTYKMPGANNPDDRYQGRILLIDKT